MEKYFIDLKEKQLFDELYEKIKTQTFTEIDVYSLYIMVRSYAESNGWIKEIGHLIAHRKRDGRAKTSKALVEIERNITTPKCNCKIPLLPEEKLLCEGERFNVKTCPRRNNFFLAGSCEYNSVQYKVKDEFTMKNFLDAKELGDEWNSLFKKFGKKQLSPDIINELLLVSFSILQFSKYGYQKGKVYGSLATILLGDGLCFAPVIEEKIIGFNYAFVEAKQYFRDTSNLLYPRWKQHYEKLKTMPLIVHRNSDKKIEIILDGEVL